MADAITGPAVLGRGERLAFTPCHHAAVRFQDGQDPPVDPVEVFCPRKGERWSVEFPAVDPREDPVALWRRA